MTDTNIGGHDRAKFGMYHAIRLTERMREVAAAQETHC